jgi:membrane protease YdiL (CAAX protease family)
MARRLAELQHALGRPEPEGPRRSLPEPWRSAVLVATLALGTACLAWSLHVPPGDRRFYLGTLLTAAVWVVGAVVTGPGRVLGAAWPRAVALAVVTGLLLVGVFVVAALLVAQLPPLASPVRGLLARAEAGSVGVVAVLTFVNGLAEELFFRGAVYRALRGRRPVLVTTVLYTAVTVASGVPLLVLAAAILSVVVGLHRRLTGGLVAPMAAHVTWSVGMLLLLPLVISPTG